MSRDRGATTTAAPSDTSARRRRPRTRLAYQPEYRVCARSRPRGDGNETRRDGHETRRDGHETRRDGHETRRDGHETSGDRQQAGGDEHQGAGEGQPTRGAGQHITGGGRQMTETARQDDDSVQKDFQSRRLARRSLAVALQGGCGGRSWPRRPHWPRREHLRSCRAAPRAPHVGTVGYRSGPARSPRGPGRVSDRVSAGAGRSNSGTATATGGASCC